MQPRLRRHKSDMRRIVFVAGSDDHINGNLKILGSKHTGPVHESVHKLVFDCNHEEWLDWKESVEQEDVMKSGVKFQKASGEARAADAKRVLRCLAEFAQDECCNRLWGWMGQDHTMRQIGWSHRHRLVSQGG